MKTTLFRNGRIYAGSGSDERYPCMLVRDGKILRLCREEPSPAEYDKTVDLEGQYVWPCLMDGHIHLLYTIVTSAMGFDVCSIEGGRIVPGTMAGVRERLTAFADGKRPGELVVANNYILSGIDERRLPDRHELDEWCGGRPAIIFTIDGHASAVSTGILKKLGFDPETHNGILTGEDNDKNMGRLTDLISGSVTPAVLGRGIARVENLCAEYGISRVGALDGNGDSKHDITTRLLIFLARRMRLGATLYLQYFDVPRAERFRRIMKRPRIGGCGSWEMDGATGSHSAAHKAPYRDTGTVAPCYYSAEEVEKTVLEADRRGFQVAAHAIGECAIDRYLAALMKTAPGRLHRLEHGEFAGEDALKLYGTGKFAVMMQPGYSWIDKRFLHSYEQFLDPSVIAKLKMKSIIEAGGIVCGSSDSPVQSLNPYQQMQGMVDFYFPDESVDIREALRSYTENAALALEEEKTGALREGYRADFFVSDRDLFAVASDDLPAFRPTGTYYGGKKYKKQREGLGTLLRLCLRPPHKI